MLLRQYLVRLAGLERSCGEYDDWFLAPDVPFQDLWNCERWLAGDSRVNLPAADFRELVAWLQSNKANVGTAGVGSASHVSGLAVQSIAGTELALVSYRSAGAALQDLAAGHIDLMFDQVSNSMPQRVRPPGA
jgi:hypothetical protein